MSNTFKIAAQLVQIILPHIMKPPEPKVPSFARLEAALGGKMSGGPSIEVIPARMTREVIDVDEPITISVQPAKPAGRAVVSTSCIACSRSHLSTVSAALAEALRFARDTGITDPEAQRRILLSEDELNILERIDLAPDAIARSPKDQQAIAYEFLPKIRKVRQDIGQIASLADLERVAAEASVTSQEFRLRDLESKGVDLSPIMKIAQKVQSGEITMEEARGQVGQFIPEEPKWRNL